MASIKPETGIEDGFEEMEHEFLLKTTGKRELPLQTWWTVCFGNKPLKQAEKSAFFHLLSKRIQFRKLFGKW